PDPEKFNESFNEYLNTEEAQALILSKAASFIDTTDAEKEMNSMMNSLSSTMAGAIGEMLGSAMEKLGPAIADNIQKAMSQTMNSMSSSMTNAFHFDANAFRDAIRLNFDEEQLSNLLTSLMGTEQDSYANNLSKLGYADLLVPDSITIYPKDFDSKEEIIRILNDYNTLMSDSGQDRKVITFTDISAALTSAVTDIVNTISYVLIAFVSISLVVSSIMIGVITYISVLERRKEIGILRAMGASKRNISEVFNAETFIIGLLSGLVGIGIALISLFPINYIVHEVTGHPEVNAFLPISSAAVLVVLSVILTLIGGIFPSRKAAKSDPVAALRSE
ncbi:MAG: ABC transporter permease, partial [Solobacterium sp.]|nr:ABC transporter permease [Solobacterium sp.]